MPLDIQRLLGWRFDPVDRTITEADCILYALSVGFGTDPLDDGERAYVFEKGLKAAPTMAAVIADLGFWAAAPEIGIDLRKLLHASHAITLHRPIPIGGSVRLQGRVTDVVDKGAGRAAIVRFAVEATDRASGQLAMVAELTAFVAEGGGFGGANPPAAARMEVPKGPPDITEDFATAPNQALLYRLNGDRNPIHADPELARSAGFGRPILHGLCTFGIAGRALLKSYCDYEPSRIRGMQARFSAPVFPGETVRTEMWKGDNHVAFRCKSVERGLVVIDNGQLDLNFA